VSTRDKLLSAFDGKPGHVLSGGILAKKLGVSRTAVWKQIQIMKNIGLPIESTGTQGYRLNAPFDSSLVRFSAPRWAAAHYSLGTSSTQTQAKAGAAGGLAEGHLWIAETQTQGRGRLDRRWESGYGGLWFSLLMRPKMPASRVPPLTLVAGLCLSETVEQFSGIETKLKWPNDLLIRTRGVWKKCAGILTEMSGQMDRTEWVVIGAGLNVNNAIPPSLSPKAVSLYTLTGKVGERARYLESFLKKFHKAYARYTVEGFEPFRRTYWSRYYAPDKPARLRTTEGLLTGLARGVDASGAIMIESRRKISLISEGEIVW